MLRFGRLFCGILPVLMLAGAAPASVAQSIAGSNRAAITAGTGSWTLENESLRAVLVFAGGGVKLTSFYNKLAEREYLTADTSAALFKYVYDGAALMADRGGWSLVNHAVADINVFGRSWGKQLVVEIAQQHPHGVTVKLVFEIYDGAAGLKFSTFIKNNDPTREKRISASDVIALNVSNAPHTLYYVPIGIRWTTSGDGSLAAGRKNCLVRYDTGDGWVLSPENNHATSLVSGGFKADPANPFLFIDAFHDGHAVKVCTNPQAVQLVLFPGEEVEYFSVNLEVFKGDWWDGRKAAAQHLRQRFKFQDPSRILGVDDWFYSDHGAVRPEAYLRSTVVPALKQMGFDLLQMDALWSTNRDTIVPDAQTFTKDLPAFAEWVNSQGVDIGYWVSLTGAKWAQGRDLADPATIALRKRQMEEVMIPQYRLRWQQIDSGELGKTDVDMAFSHPSDSVYRKFLAFKEYCTYIAHRHPEVLIRETCEFENLFKGGSASLMALNDNAIAGNFWGSSGGMAGKPLFAKDLFCYFGLYPAEGMLGYVGPLQFDASVEQMYQWLTARDIGIYTDPGLFSGEDMARVRKFTDWMHNPRIKTLLNEIACPVASGGTLAEPLDPFLWMFVAPARDKALLIGNTTENAPALMGKLRWLDSGKNYLIEDISLHNDGVVRYAFGGRKSGAELTSAGFRVDFAASHTLAKAYWIQEIAEARPQVLYADDKITSYSEQWNGTSLSVDVQGMPNATAALVAYKDSVANTEVKTVALDSHGHGRTAFDAASVTTPLPPPSGPVAGQSSLALWTVKWQEPYFAPIDNAVPKSNLALGRRAAASSTSGREHEAGMAIDAHRDTSWTAARGQANDQWLEVDFGAPMRFDTVITRERAERVTGYRIQTWDGTWHDVVRGTRIGAVRTDRFPPMLASKVRLYITSATDSPSIDELEVYRTRLTSAEEEHKL